MEDKCSIITLGPQAIVYIPAGLVGIPLVWHEYVKPKWAHCWHIPLMVRPWWDSLPARTRSALHEFQKEGLDSTENMWVDRRAAVRLLTRIEG